MGFYAKVICDSISPDDVRITTVEICFPRIVLAEFNTHRVFSRNSASSRAIPVEKRIAAVESDPFIPTEFGKNQKGMQADGSFVGDDAVWADHQWRMACYDAVQHARKLAAFGVHKQLANRLLEPFCWHSVVVTATEWSNFFGLRCNPAAQPEIRAVAEMMRSAMAESTPQRLASGEWHLPYVWNDVEIPRGLPQANAAKISAARCARVSYLTQDGRRDIDEDMRLASKLEVNGHMSPFEHPAIIVNGLSGCEATGNFRPPWLQLRKMLPHEDDFSKRAP